MSVTAASEIQDVVERVYRTESRRVFATLVRLLGDFDLAEEALSDAFASAVAQWPNTGVPSNPRDWLVSAGRFKAIDTMRRRARFDASLTELANQLDTNDDSTLDSEGIEDDRLRLIFTCCHPALSPEAQVALTLREVCGLTTEAIASAFLTTPSTLAQRIVRAKAKIREAGIPYQVPARDDLPDRLHTVLQVIYLVFNEGYSASSGKSLTRPDLSEEAIRLGRLMVELLPDPEVVGLLALMLLHESRRTARNSPSGELVLLDDQDRSLWDRVQIDEGKQLVTQAFAGGQFGPYTIQAGIAAVHADASTTEATDWAQIGGAVRCARARGPFAGRRVESGRGGGDARRSRGGARVGGRDFHAGRLGGLSFGPRHPSGLLPPAGQNGRRSGILSASAQLGSPGTRTAFSGRQIG